MADFLAFADIFRFSEQEFVYLACTESINYAAKILDRGVTRTLDKRLKAAERLGEPHRSRAIESPMYCFIILKTPSFNERAAHFGNAGKDEFSPEVDKIGTLLPNDSKELMRAILDSKGVPPKLQELIKLLK